MRGVPRFAGRRSTPTLALPEGVKKLGWGRAMDQKLKNLGLTLKNNLRNQL